MSSVKGLSINRDAATLLLSCLIALSGFYLAGFHKIKLNSEAEMSETSASRVKPNKNQIVQPFFISNHEFSCKKLFHRQESEIDRVGSSKTPYIFDYQWYQKLLIRGCDPVLKGFYWPISSNLTSIAYTLIINEDINLFLLQLHALYTANNVFSIHVDLKAVHYIHKSVEIIVNCINEYAGQANIKIIPNPISLPWGGWGLLEAKLICLNQLIREFKDWKYVFTLEAGDFPLKTQSEISKILDLLNGTNEIDLDDYPLDEVPPGSVRVEYHRHLGHPVGFVQASEGSCETDPWPHNLTLYKGLSASALTRGLVKFMLSSPISRDLRYYFKRCAGINDEVLWQTLGFEDTVRAPGYYPGRCLKKKPKDYFVRLVLWRQNEPDYNLCQSKNFRTDVCLFSEADLFHLAQSKKLFLNKIKKNHVALFCVHELIIRNTYPELHTWDIEGRFDLQYYNQTSAVRFARWQSSGKDADAFPC